MATAAVAVPPDATTPMNANCDPPVNMSSDSAMVCARSSPAATDSAPNETPYRPVASDTESAWRTAARTSSRPPSVTRTGSHTRRAARPDAAAARPAPNVR